MNWAFLLLDLLIPALLIVFGITSKKIAEGPVNFWIGYRTSRSTASREAWEFANLTMGRVMLREGIVEISVSLIFGLLAFFLCTVEVQGTVTVLLELVQVLTLVAAIPWMEEQLKKRFE